MRLSVDRALSLSKNLAATGHLAAADAVLRRGLERFPSNKRLRVAHKALVAVPEAGTPNLTLSQRALAWLRDGRTDYARAGFEALLQRSPGLIMGELGMASVDRADGRIDAARTRLERIVAQVPSEPAPYRALSEMRRTEPGDGWLETLEIALRAAKTPNDQSIISYALGKALADLGETDKAFEAYEVANGLKRDQRPGELPHGARHLLDWTQRCAGWAETGPILRDPPWQGAPRPIFILGLPRSGSTLVERILSQHSSIGSGGERRDLSDVIAGVIQRDDLTDARTLREIREAYMLRAPILSGSAQYFTDKMPANARWVEVMRRAFPEAKIIETRRDPVAVGWSLYRQDFARSGMLFATRLEDIADYISAHEVMMNLWRRRAPDRLVQVDYDALCRTPTTAIRQLLDDLDLPFEEACLSPEENTASVQTSSQYQVRAPIHQDATQSWSRYARHLSPLLELKDARSSAA